MTQREKNELKRLSQKVEKAIVKYGKTIVLKELSEVVCFDHIHYDYHINNQHIHQNENLNHHSPLCETKQTTNLEKPTVFVEKQDEDVKITRLNKE